MIQEEWINRKNKWIYESNVCEGSDIALKLDDISKTDSREETEEEKYFEFYLFTL